MQAFKRGVEDTAMETSNVHLTGEFIELNKLLKLESIVSSGGEAKQAIASGAVHVDGQEESRTRRKLYAGSVVVVGEVTINILAK